MAFARMGNAERARQLWSMLSPINHTLNANSVGIYKAEPYVMSADVYSVAPHIGRAGWSWYTGSSGWARRLLTEELLGIKRSGADLTVHARLPDGWPSFLWLINMAKAIIRLVSHAAMQNIALHWMVLSSLMTEYRCGMMDKTIRLRLFRTDTESDAH